jgi:hypothetical protein
MRGQRGACSLLEGGQLVLNTLEHGARVVPLLV